ncbi:ABC transporter permease [Meiothermus granaticius NBRC 107808]|uniref:Inner membrane ABC transporter permease protein YcjO n=1 Tax=Meiothermus granaticius NBRC 107808 TaxID=1227551 RepID=A0A399F558_9DEIN|nr:Inner membrane ABC transporter permease protein YcjO [Meiothermus granaticius NBRC 107808]GEM85483.1 ABC transporter permease [Meiothermus granaticius NBRC 107808]
MEGKQQVTSKRQTPGGSLVSANLRANLEPYWYLLPTLLVLGGLLLVPLIYGVASSFQRWIIYDPLNRGWVGLSNYAELLRDPLFWQALKNTLVWTLGSLVFQFSLGLGLALLLVKPFPLRTLYQAVVFLPWAVPPFLGGMTWKWLFNSNIGPISDLLMRLHLRSDPLNMLSDPQTALWGAVIANVWFGIPFFAITFLAALQSIPNELYEAAAIDGAGSWRSFTHITLPFLVPTMVITVLLRSIWIANFTDLIWVMTGGGPANSSQILTTYIFSTAYTKLDFGYAATLSTALLVLLGAYALVVTQVRRMVRV